MLRLFGAVINIDTFTFSNSILIIYNVPVKKCDMDSHGKIKSSYTDFKNGNSHGNSVSQVTNWRQFWSKLTRNSMNIPCHLYRFYLLSMRKHDMDFGQIQVMEFSWHLLRKWWDFPFGFGLIFDQTAVENRGENPCTFFTGYKQFLTFDLLKFYNDW